jgi:hypothetical protein
MRKSKEWLTALSPLLSFFIFPIFALTFGFWIGFLVNSAFFLIIWYVVGSKEMRLYFLSFYVLEDLAFFIEANVNLTIGWEHQPLTFIVIPIAKLFSYMYILNKRMHLSQPKNKFKSSSLLTIKNTLHCPKCGKELTTQTEFCPQCGMKLPPNHTQTNQQVKF